MCQPSVSSPPIPGATLGRILSQVRGNAWVRRFSQFIQIAGRESGCQDWQGPKSKLGPKIGSIYCWCILRQADLGIGSNLSVRGEGSRTRNVNRVRGTANLGIWPHLISLYIARENIAHNIAVPPHDAVPSLVKPYFCPGVPWRHRATPNLFFSPTSTCDP